MERLCQSLVLSLWVGGSLTACTADEIVAQARIPGTSTPARFVLVHPRSTYIDATIETGGYTLRFFLPASGDCAVLAHVDEMVRYQSLGPLGRIVRDELRCDPVGILSLRAWRDRQPRGSRGGRPVPRAQATLSEVYRDDELVVVQGRFPLAGRIGWVGGAASRAVLPAEPLCDEVVEAGVASMEYRPAGPRPFSLVGPGGLCPIIGFVEERPPASTGSGS